MADKVTLTYSGSEGVVNYDVAREGYDARLAHGDYDVSEELAFRLLQTHGWNEKEEGQLTEKAQEAGASPKFSTDPGGEASETNPGDVRYWQKYFADRGEEYPPKPPEEQTSDGDDSGPAAEPENNQSEGLSSAQRPEPGSTGSIFGGRRTARQEDDDNEEGGNV